MTLSPRRGFENEKKTCNGLTEGMERSSWSERLSTALNSVQLGKTVGLSFCSLLYRCFFIRKLKERHHSITKNTTAVHLYCCLKDPIKKKANSQIGWIGPILFPYLIALGLLLAQISWSDTEPVLLFYYFHRPLLSHSRGFLRFLLLFLWFFCFRLFI